MYAPVVGVLPPVNAASPVKAAMFPALEAAKLAISLEDKVPVAILLIMPLKVLGVPVLLAIPC